MQKKLVIFFASPTLGTGTRVSLSFVC